jgi:hypothetical protein
MSFIHSLTVCNFLSTDTSENCYHVQKKQYLCVNLPIQSQYIPSFLSAIPTSCDGHKIALRLPTALAPPELRAGQLLTFMAANVHAQMTISHWEYVKVNYISVVRWPLNVFLCAGSTDNKISYTGLICHLTPGCSIRDCWLLLRWI